MPPQATVKNLLGAACQGERKFCPYCLRLGNCAQADGMEDEGSFISHLKDHHADEKDVKDYFQITEETFEDKIINRGKQRWLLSEIQNKGVYLHNVARIAEGRELKDDLGRSGYGFVQFFVCGFCLKTLKNSVYYNHFDKCAFTPDDDNNDDCERKVKYKHSILLLDVPEISEEFNKVVLTNIQKGCEKWKQNVSSFAKTDPLILTFGLVIYSGTKPYRQDVCKRLQELSKAFILMKKLNGYHKAFEECFHPKFTKDFITVVTKMYKFYQYCGGRYKEEFGARLGSSLEFCVRILKTRVETHTFLSQQDKIRRVRVLDDFWEKLNIESSNKFCDLFDKIITIDEIILPEKRQSASDVIPKDDTENKTKPLGKSCCPYCMTFHKSFVKHLKKQHAGEEDVKEYLQAKDDDAFVLKAKQKFLLQEIKNKGSCGYNLKLLAKEQQMKATAGPVSALAGHNNSDYTICKLCLTVCKAGSTHFYHFERCAFSPDGVNDVMVNVHSSHLMGHIPQVSMDFNVYVLRRIGGERWKENLCKVIKSDPLILSVGWTLYSIYNCPDVDTRLQDLSKVFMLMNKINGDLKAFEDCFSPPVVDVMIYAINFMYSIYPYKTLRPKILPRISSSLDYCVCILKSKIEKHSSLLKLEKTLKMRDLNNFLKHLSEKWQIEFSCDFDYKEVIVSEISSQSEHNTDIDSEVIQAFSFLSKECESLIKDLVENLSLEAYTTLTKWCIALVFIFNQELAIDEVTRALLQDYLECRELHDLMQSDLSGQSQPLDGLYKFYYIRRGTEFMPCFLNRLMKKSIDVLVSKRNYLGISSCYLFPRATSSKENSNSYISPVANSSKEIKTEWCEGYLIINELKSVMNSRKSLRLLPPLYDEIFSSRRIRKHTISRERLVKIGECIEKTKWLTEEICSLKMNKNRLSDNHDRR